MVDDRREPTVDGTVAAARPVMQEAAVPDSRRADPSDLSQAKPQAFGLLLHLLSRVRRPLERPHRRSRPVQAPRHLLAAKTLSALADGIPVLRAVSVQRNSPAHARSSGRLDHISDFGRVGEAGELGRLPRPPEPTLPARRDVPSLSLVSLMKAGRCCAACHR
jgi:hypothetical protein